MDLLDSNIWLERLLGQNRAAEVAEYLATTPSNEIYITDFALNSIALLLARRGRLPVLLTFIRDTIIDRNVRIISLPLDCFPRLAEIITDHGLDYDDAYQYAAAEEFGLRIVSFDRDFDRTPLGRTTPAEILPSRP